MMKPRTTSETRTEVVYPAGRPPLTGGGMASGWSHPAASFVAAPAAALYGIVSRAIGTARRRARRQRLPDVTIVSIGNLEVGGNGKTPFALHVLERLIQDGHRPVYVSRGYKSESERIRAVTVVAPDGRPQAEAFADGFRLVSRGSPLLSRAIGDEAAMVVLRRPDVPVLLSADKGRAVTAAARLFSPTHAIVDDAFQTWPLYRDVDIVLLDAGDPFGPGRLVPAGTLRELPAALRRADWVAANGCRSAGDLQRFKAEVERRTHATVQAFGIARAIDLVDPHGGDVVGAIAGSAATLSSIARPERFDEMLRNRGVEVTLSLRYPDHHRYHLRDLDVIVKWVGARGCRQVVTTDKDWAKLRELEPGFEQLLIARLRLSVIGRNVLDQIERPQGLPAASRNDGVS